MLWACGSEPLEGVTGGCGPGSGRLIGGSGKTSCVSGFDRRSMLIAPWLSIFDCLGKIRLVTPLFSTRIIRIRIIRAMSVSRILILSGPDFSGAAAVLGGAGFLGLRDFLCALLIGYYMHFTGYLTNEIGPMTHGTRGRGYAFETWLGDLIYEC